MGHINEKDGSGPAAGEMLDFLEKMNEDRLALISKKVLHRPQDCLSNLKAHLRKKMVNEESDQRARLWDDGVDSHILYYPAHRGVVQLELKDASPLSKLEKACTDGLKSIWF